MLFAVIYLHVKWFMSVGSRRTSNTFISLSPARVCIIPLSSHGVFFIASLIVITLDLCSCLPGFSAPVNWGHSPGSLSIGLFSEPEHPRPLNPSKTQNSSPGGMRTTSGKQAREPNRLEPIERDNRRWNIFSFSPKKNTFSPSCFLRFEERSEFILNSLQCLLTELSREWGEIHQSEMLMLLWKQESWPMISSCLVL